METVGTERILLCFLLVTYLTLSGNKHQIIKVSWLLALQINTVKTRKSDLHTLAVMNLKGTEKPGVPGVFPLVIVSRDNDIFIAVGLQQIFSRIAGPAL